MRSKMLGLIVSSVAVGLTALTACTPNDASPTATVTQVSTVTRISTVTQSPEAPDQREPAATDSEICAGFRAQKQVNQRLAGDGYADDYGAEYDALLQASGCSP